MKKVIFAVSGVAVSVIVTLLLPDTLRLDARAALGILAWAIVWWIAGVLPDFVTTMGMGALFVVVCHVPTQTAFSAFSGSSWWLLMTAFGLSLGVTKSGLMHRISLYVLKLFPGTFAGQVLALISVGAVTAPFIPSMSAKTAMMAPLAMEVSDSMGYERKTGAANGLFLAMLVGVRNPGPLFISASVLGYAFLGQYPAEFAETYTMGYWFAAALPWFVCVSGLSFLTIYLLFRPRIDTAQSTDIVKQELEALGEMSGREKKMLFIILITMLLWATESLHGIPSHIVAIAALCMTIAGGVITAKQFSAEMNWGSVLYIGVVLGLSSVFDELGINDWLVSISTSVFYLFSKNPYLLLLCVGGVTVLLRFVIVSEVALVGIIMAFLVPLAVRLDIQPWIIGFAVYALVSPWFFIYQNPVYMAAFYAVDGQMIQRRPVALYCIVYILICLTGLALSIPYWQMIGIYHCRLA